MECKDDDLQELISTLEIIVEGDRSAFLNLPKAILILAKEIEDIKKRCKAALH